MTVQRSDEFILVAFFLSRYGRKVEGRKRVPPAQLGADSWRGAYAAFFEALGAGRSLGSFHNSLKATRDRFDGHVDSGRRGWRGRDDGPAPLRGRYATIFDIWGSRSEEELWQAVRSYCDLGVASLPSSVLDDLDAESMRADEQQVSLGREGRSRAVVSRTRERSPRLRAAALRIHGYLCQVCGFDFGRTYGAWGRAFVEVHHLQELGAAPSEGIEVDPATDLAVVCANCHRMIHRKAKRALTVAELRRIIADASESSS
ncbi:MAG: HNH endonuclease [Chloroflexota bacterium]|nr:HNH endonuclease [Chloroflexota bacterium]